MGRIDGLMVVGRRVLVGAMVVGSWVGIEGCVVVGEVVGHVVVGVTVGFKVGTTVGCVGYRDGT